MTSSPSEVETWREVTSCLAYEVSNLGRVRRRLGAGRFHKSQKILKATLAANGYPRVTLFVGLARPTYVHVHVLVCEAFHGPRPTAQHEVAHWDGIRPNIDAGNLYWGTHQDNREDRKRHDTVGHKLTIEQAREILSRLERGESHRAIASDYPITRHTVSRINRGKLWGWLRHSDASPHAPESHQRHHQEDRMSILDTIIQDVKAAEAGAPSVISFIEGLYSAVKQTEGSVMPLFDELLAKKGEAAAAVTTSAEPTGGATKAAS